MKGEGNQQDYGERIYDPRLGKFLSVDPLTPEYPMLTPYQFASNRPIDGIDQDGLEWKPVTGADGNVTDYTWSGFNADGSAPAGTVSGGSVSRDGANYNYSSSSYLNSGFFSVDDGSNIRTNAQIHSNSASYSFEELNDDGRVKTVFESGDLGSGAEGASGGQFANVLNKKYQAYERANTPQLASGSIESDGLGLFDWIGPGEVKALLGGLTTTIIKKEVASTIFKKATNGNSFSSFKKFKVYKMIANEASTGKKVITEFGKTSRSLSTRLKEKIKAKYSSGKGSQFSNVQIKQVGKELNGSLKASQKENGLVRGYKKSSNNNKPPMQGRPGGN